MKTQVSAWNICKVCGKGGATHESCVVTLQARNAALVKMLSDCESTIATLLSGATPCQQDRDVQQAAKAALAAAKEGR